MIKKQDKDAYQNPIWLMYECDHGKRWTAVKGGFCEHDLKDFCNFSGCEKGHFVRLIGETIDRKTAHLWFRR